MPVKPVNKDFSEVLPVDACGLSTKPLSFSLRSFPLVMPVRRSSSARFTFSRLKFKPCSLFNSLSACVNISVKPSCFRPAENG